MSEAKKHVAFLSDDEALHLAIERSLQAQLEVQLGLNTPSVPTETPGTTPGSTSASVSTKATPAQGGSAWQVVTPKPYYVIFTVPKDREDLLGIHHCSWPHLVEKLPGGKLFGSGCADCKKYDTEDEAVDYFILRNKYRITDARWIKIHQ